MQEGLPTGLFGDAPWEVRFALDGAAAVRVAAPHGPVARRHAETRDPPAPWRACAACGPATGWLLATAPPADPQAASVALQRWVQRRCVAELADRDAVARALVADLLEDLTHRLRTDVSTLQVVAEGALRGAFAGDADQIAGEIGQVGQEAHRRLSAARDAMVALDPHRPSAPEPLVGALVDELAARGLRRPIAVAVDEQPMAHVRGAAWGACARLAAAALADDPRFGGTAGRVSVLPDPRGWLVRLGTDDAGQRTPAPTRSQLGALVDAARVLVCGGGRVGVSGGASDRLAVLLTVPAASSR